LGKNLPHSVGFVLDLEVREPQRREACSGVILVACRITRLGGGGAVPAQAVCLDDEAELRPEEVDPVAVDMNLGLRRREAGRERDRNEEALELRLGEDELVTVEEAAEDSAAG